MLLSEILRRIKQPHELIRDGSFDFLEQCTRIFTLGRSISRIVISWITTGRAFRSTSFPALAKSQSFCPLTFSAEYMGGICS